jgi:hypothetical protein
MERSILVRPYDASTGFVIDAMPDAEVLVRVAGGEAAISANPAGLLWLAQALVSLAEQDVPAGAHVHLEPGMDLDAGSAPLVLDRIE